MLVSQTLSPYLSYGVLFIIILKIKKKIWFFGGRGFPLKISTKSGDVLLYFHDIYIYMAASWHPPPRNLESRLNRNAIFHINNTFIYIFIYIFYVILYFETNYVYLNLVFIVLLIIFEKLHWRIILMTAFVHKTD